jgi:hypothetical protein
LRRNIFVRIRFTQSGAYDCTPYSLSYFFDAGLCR